MKLGAIIAERERERRAIVQGASIVHNFAFNGATARTLRVGSQLSIDYFGIINEATSEHLLNEVMPDRRGAVVVLERLDRALTIFAVPAVLNLQLFPLWLPPMAVVMREDQMARGQELSQRLAQIGVIRVPFLISQLDWALAFVDRVALRLSRAPRHMH